MQEVSVFEWWVAQAENMKVIDEMYQQGGQQASSILAINQIQYMQDMLTVLEDRYVSEEVQNRYKNL